MPKIAFVTGGTGFIGSHLVDRLLAEGWDEVRCLVRRDPKWLRGKPVVRVPGTLDDFARFAPPPAATGGVAIHGAATGEAAIRGTPGGALPASTAAPPPHLDDLRRALSDVTHIFHFAALTRARSWNEFMTTNVLAPVGLLECAVEVSTRLERAVVAGSLAVVGRAVEGVADESAPMQPVSAYGRSKAELERAIGAPSDPQSLHARLPIAVVRPPAVYGPRERDIYTYFRAASRGVCAVPIDRRRRLSLVHVHDVVAGSMLAAEHPAAGGGTYFLGPPDTVGWLDFAREVRSAVTDQLRRPVVTVPVPRPIFRAAGALVEDVASAFGLFPPFHREKAAEMVDACAACSSDAAIAELGYSPNVEIAEGVPETLAWYRANGFL